MKDWLNDYSKEPQKFQAGGEMASAGGQEQGPDMDAMLAEYAQSRDPQLAVAICDILVEVIAQQAVGSAPTPEAAPMARKGTKMSSGPVFKA